MSFYAKIILDSIGPCGNRLTTMEFTLPKLWLAEFNTHCAFARNSASTRAIPYQKQRQRVIDDPFIPFEWPIEGKGMAHTEKVTDISQIKALERKWEIALQTALQAADSLANPSPGVSVSLNPGVMQIPPAHSSIHKQLAGRLLEPWQFQTVLVTGDQAAWANFFYLRLARDPVTHKWLAAPEIRRPAELMLAEYKGSTPKKLRAGEWHAPLMRDDEHVNEFQQGPPFEHQDYDRADWRGGPITWWTFSPTDFVRISAARCARLSYLTQHGVRDPQEDLAMCDRLTQNGHWSPLEHVCQAMPKPGAFIQMMVALTKKPKSGGFGAELVVKKYGKWDGWRSLRSMYPNEYVREYVGE